MTIRLVDPTLGPPTSHHLATRPTTLDGAVIGLVNNGKTWGHEILQRLFENLSARHDIKRAISITKPNYSFPASPEDVALLSADASAIIAAIGD